MKNKKLLLSFLGIYGLYCFSLAFIAPIFIKPLIPEQAKNFIHGSVELNAVRINPFTHSVSIEGVILKNKQGAVLASIEELSANIDLLPFVFLNADLHLVEINNLQLFTDSTIDNTTEKNAWLTLPKLMVEDTSIAIQQQNVYVNQIILEKLLLAPILNADKSTNIDLFLAEIETLLISEEVAANDNIANNTTSNEISLVVENTELENTASENTSPVTSPNDIAAEPESTPWLVHIANIQLKNASINLLDQSVITEQFAQGISTIIYPINISVHSVHTDFSKDISLNLMATLLKGKLEIKGKINPNSMANTLTYQLSDLQLSELNPYVEYYSLASIPSGSFSTQGEITTGILAQEILETAATTEPVLEIKLTNSSEIKSLLVKHQQFDTTLLNCASINTNNLDFVLPASTLTLDKISVQECVINPILSQNGTNNFDLAKAQTASATQDSPNESAQAETNKELTIDIKLVEILNSEINVEDFTQGERVNVHFGNIQAQVDNIRAGNVDLTNYQLSALLNKHAPLAIEGNGNFLNEKLSTQGKVTLQNLGLKEFSPYSLNIGSRAIDKGVLALDITIDAKENKLDSLASIDLLGLELGKKQNIEGASKLPIGMALSILKDTKGNINIGVPVKGDLDDPTFSVNKQIIKTLTGIITKAATAPLSMVGGLVTGGDNTNSLQIIFEEAQSTLNAQQQKNLADISKVLKKRPELSVRLVSLLNANERLVVTDSAAQNDLMTQRQTAVMNALLALEVSPLQIDMPAIDSSLISENSEVSIEFFSR